MNISVQNSINTIARDVTVSEDAVIGSNVVFGDFVSIGKGAVIGANTIIGYHENAYGEPPVTVIGKNAVIRSGTVIYAGCRIGDFSTIGHNCVLRDNTIIGHHTYIGTLACVEGETVIGNYVGIQSQCYITRFCRVGDYTFIAPRFAGANDAAMTHRRRGHGNNLEGFTTGKAVRIGIGVISLPGVHFGEGCIAGAGSVVTRNVPPYAVVMGVPARVVRQAPRDEVIEPR